mgnify:CR=1 FL=1
MNFKQIVLHIPHSSFNFDLVNGDPLEILGREFMLQSMTLVDCYTDELFVPDNPDDKIVPVVFDTCRTLIDVERQLERLRDDFLRGDACWFEDLIRDGVI